MFIIRGCKFPNLGDSANVNLVQAITGESPKIVNNSTKLLDDQINYLVMGSVIGWSNQSSVIWGAGMIDKNSLPKETPKQILAVRGKETRQELLEHGFECPEIYGDPFLLMPRFFPMNVTKTHKIGIIPHQIESHLIPQLTQQFPDCKIIDITQPVIDCIKEINSCETIVSSALHGLICADAYEIPCIWMKITNRVLGNGFKYRDYYSSIGQDNAAPLAYTKQLTENDLLKTITKNHRRLEIDLEPLWSCCPFKKEK